MPVTPEETLADEERQQSPALPETPEEVLADEAPRRRRAAIAAFLAAALLVLGGMFSLPAVIATGVLVTPIYADYPDQTLLLDALRERPGAGEVGARARKVLFYDEHAGAIVAMAFLRVICVVLFAYALAFLFRATATRRPQMRRGVLIALLGGAVAIAIGELVSTLSLVIEAGAFADANDQSAQAATDVLSSGGFVAGLLLDQFGILALSIAVIFLSLNAMRVGLLTRFLGVLGMIIGGLFIIPLQSTLPLVQVFWLASIGLLLAGRWPPGMPAAWTAGEARPWPSRQELYEAKLAARAERNAKGLEAPERERRQRRSVREDMPETPAPEAPTKPAHSSSKKKKRKRRG